MVLKIVEVVCYVVSVAAVIWALTRPMGIPFEEDERK